MKISSAPALAIVVAVPLAALLGVAIVPFVSGASAELEQTTRSLAAGLRYTRNRALSNNRPETFALDTRKREFDVPDEAGARKLPETVDIEFFTNRARHAPRPGGVIRFFPDGSSTGGRVELAAGDSRYLVNVDWLTGKVHVIESVVDDARGR